MIQLWRLLLFSGAASGLTWLLLSFGWTLRQQEQLRVSGSGRLGADAVSKAAGLTFPLPLLSLDPRELETTLMQELPVQSASVHRRLLPPGLDVELEDRRPMAAATRVGPKGMERGMVDRRGQWMPQNVAAQGEKPETAIQVMGWSLGQRGTIARLLDRRDALGSTLQQIRIEADGSISLRTQVLGEVQLGGDPGLLDQQVVTMALLSRSLPGHLRQKPGTSIDLSDPSKPELQLRTAEAKTSKS